MKYHTLKIGINLTELLEIIKYMVYEIYESWIVIVLKTILAIILYLNISFFFNLIFF